MFEARSSCSIPRAGRWWRALAFGRAIRGFDMTTTVGKTILLPSDDDKARARLSPNASCESMCAFVLLGGTRRYVPPQARVLVHRSGLETRALGRRESSYSAKELGVVQHDIGGLRAIRSRWAAPSSSWTTALRVPPWKPMYALAPDEVHRMRLANLESLSREDIAPGSAQASWDAAPAFADALATVTQTQGGRD